MRKFIDFLGLKKSIAAVLLMVVLVGLGEKIFERFLPIYLIALIGAGPFANTIIGLLNGLNNLLNALYSFPAGYISDKFGYKKALTIFNISAMIGYLVVIFIQHWLAVIIGAIFFMSWSAVSLPATMSLVSKVLPPNKRTMGVSLHSFIRRIPMALGPLIGGYFLLIFGEKKGITFAFICAFVLALVALLVQQFFIEEDKTHNKAEINPFKVLRFMCPDLKKLLISDILIRFCEQIPYAFVVVWCMKNLHQNSLNFGLLTTIEMITAMLIYIPVAYLADKSVKKPFVVITFIFFSLFPLILLFSHNFYILIFAFVIRGLKEFGEGTRKALILDLAPEDKKAAMFGLYYLIRDTIVSIAAFGGAFLWNISPEFNLLTAFTFGSIGTIYFVIYGSDLSIHKKE